MANEFYILMEGTKQGKFKGEANKEKWKDKSVGIGFSFEVKSPTDVASGLPTGKRQYLPIKITKQWGASSPQIFQALVSREILKTVLFEFVKSNSKGAEEVFQMIKITNATIVNHHQYINANTDSKQSLELEDVSFVFQKIEIRNRIGTMATDDWKSV